MSERNLKFRKKIKVTANQQSEYKMSLYELEGIPKAYSLQAQEVQRGREAKIQHLLAQVWFFFHIFYIIYGGLKVFFCKVFKRQ